MPATFRLPLITLCISAAAFFSGDRANAVFDRQPDERAAIHAGADQPRAREWRRGSDAARLERAAGRSAEHQWRSVDDRELASSRSPGIRCLFNCAQNHAKLLNDNDQFFLASRPHTFGGWTRNQRIAAAGYSMATYNGPTTSGGFFPGPENVAEKSRFGSGPIPARN